MIVAAFVAYVPLLATSPGVVGADTKSYLTIDPDRLLSAAAWMWQPDTGLGTVTHQNIGYLWPMGPWFWVFEHLGVPDWVAQRLWLGTMLFVAATGVRHLLRTLGWRGSGVAAASMGYMLSPYVLHYSARISVLLLPWAGLGWLIALTIKSIRHRGWRYPALFALGVTTVGSINATSLLLIGLGPLLWLVHERIILHRPVREIVPPALRIGAASLAVSLWWIAGLVIQSGYSLPVTRYTETYEVVSNASTSTEVFRGLGYWFFYGLDKLGPWVAPSVDYTNRTWLLALSFAIPLLGVAGVVMTRWRHRAYFVSMIVVGGLASIAAHPFDDPSFLGNIFKDFTETDAGLAMRSTPRAEPLMVLGLAVMLGALVRAGSEWMAVRKPVLKVGMIEAVVCLLLVVNLQPLWSLGMVEEHLQRDEDLPDYWLEAASHVDEADDDTRVFEIPGSDFASYRWGNTVDPILPGLIDRPSIARELVPFGSAASAALVSALDVRMQEDTLEPEAMQPILDLMAIGDVLYRADLKYERFRTPRPEPFWAYLREVDGLGEPVLFGEGVDHTAGPEQPLRDEVALGLDPELESPSGVAVFPVEDTQSITRTLPADRSTIVVGDADGLIDAAASGLVDTSQPSFFAATLNHDPDLAEVVLDGATSVVLTDSNRRRAQKWGGIREVMGYTEPSRVEALRRDAGDARLPVFPDAEDDEFTIAEHDGPLVANATAYGNPVSYTANDRPVLAFDGDPTTAWRVAAFDDPRGDRIEATLDEPTNISSVTLLQPTTGFVNRLITRVRIHFDDGSHFDADIDPDSSRRDEGQRVEFPERTTSLVGIEILDTNVGPRPVYYGISAVGFAEILLGDSPTPTVEQTRLPIRFVAENADRLSDSPIDITLRRLRSNPAEPVRGEPELAMRRTLELPFTRAYSVEGTARLSAAAPEQVVDRIVGLERTRAGDILSTSSSEHLPGSLRSRASSAFDADPATSWISGFDAPEGTTLRAVREDSTAADRVTITFDEGPERSRVVAVSARIDGVAIDEPVPVVDGAATIELARASGTQLEIEIAEIEPFTTKDWYSGEDTAFPVAVSSIDAGPGFTLGPPSDSIDRSCRNDLLTVDDRRIPIRITGSVDDAVARRPLDIEECDAVPMTEGRTDIETAQGRLTGVDIDQLAFLDTLRRPDRTSTAPAAMAEDRRRDAIDVEVEAGEQPYWLVLGQSFNDGWEASGDPAIVRSSPVLINGYANGWLVEPAGNSVSASLVWTPQRLVWIAGGVSLLSAAFLVLVVVRRRERDAEPVLTPPTLGGPSASERPGDLIALAATVGAFLLGLLLVADMALIAGAVAAATLLAALRRSWPVRLPALAAMALFCVGAGFTVLQQFRHRYPPDFTWPVQFEAVHALGMLAFVLLAIEWLRIAIRRR